MNMKCICLLETESFTFSGKAKQFIFDYWHLIEKCIAFKYYWNYFKQAEIKPHEK